MRIAVVASPVTPLRSAQLGGAQAFVSDLAVGLTRRGHDVTLHCAAGSEVPGVRLAPVPAPRDAKAALVMPGGAAPPPAPGVAAALAAPGDHSAGRGGSCRACRKEEAHAEDGDRAEPAGRSRASGCHALCRAEARASSSRRLIRGFASFTISSR